MTRSSFKFLRFWFLFALIFFIPSMRPLFFPAEASSTQDVRIEGSSAFLEGKFSGSGLNDMGELVMGMSASKLQAVEEVAYILSGVEVENKTCFGSGHPAAVISYDGKSPAILARFPADIAVSALASDGRALYAATLPSAAIYKVDDKGGTAPFADFASSAASPNYIWSMSVHRGALYAALGGHFPSVYKIDLKTGKKQLLYRVSGKARNVTALLVSADGIFFGDDAGRVFRMPPEGSGQAEVLYAFSDAEVKSLAPMEDGLAVAVNSRRMAPPPPVPPAKEPPKPGEEVVEEEEEAEFAGEDFKMSLEKVAQAVDTDLREVDRRGPKPPPPGPQPKTESPGAQGQAFPPVYQDPFGKGEGNLFWMSLDGSRVHRLWFSQSSIVLSILPGQDGVWVATSNPARLYNIGISGNERLFYESNSKDLSVILSASKKMLAASSNPASIAELQPAQSAEYVSKVFDAGFPSRIGRPEMLGNGSEAAEIFYRYGSTADVDSGWVDFKSLAAASPQASGRFFQVKLRLKSPESAIRRLRVPYRIQNLYSRLVNLSAEVVPSQDGSSDNHDIRLAWDAVNLDNDVLQYQISYRPPGSKKFIPLFEPSARPRSVKNHNVQAEQFTDGLYRFRIEVTDEPSNGLKESLTAAAEFPMVLLDRTPPVMELKQDGKDLRWLAYDAASRIVRAEYRVDGGPWQALLPDDGLFDTIHESGRVSVSDLAGASVIDARAFDERDNSRIYSVILK